MTRRVGAAEASGRDTAASCVVGRSGISIVEVLVALLVLTVGMSLSMRVLSLASRSLDESELGLQALFVLSELTDANRRAVDPRPAGPGRLVPDLDSAGLPTVRYEPPAGGAGGDEAGNGVGPYMRPHEWRLPIGSR